MAKQMQTNCFRTLANQILITCSNSISDKNHSFDPMNSRTELLMELQNTKLDLNRTREESMQSWLDSRPLIDHLENLKSTLASANERISKSNSLILDLTSNLESTHLEIQSKKTQEIKTHEFISQLNQHIAQTHHELEQIKLETDEKQIETQSMRQTLAVKKQSLLALQMKLRAVKMESNGFEASEKDAIGYINVESGTVRISLIDYELLRKKAKEDSSFTNWRVIMFEEQRSVAEANMEKAMKRLKEVEDEDKELSDVGGAAAPAVVIPRIRRISSRKKKKKKSIFVRIKISLLKKIKKCCG